MLKLFKEVVLVRLLPSQFRILGVLGDRILILIVEKPEADRVENNQGCHDVFEWLPCFEPNAQLTEVVAKIELIA